MKNFATILLIFMFKSSINGQALNPPPSVGHQVRKEGKLVLDVASLDARSLFHALNEQIFTDLAVSIKGKSYVFRVSLSAKVELSGGKEIAFDGYEPGNKKNRIFLMVSPDQCFASVWVNGDEYTIAPLAEVQKASFMNQLKARGNGVLPFSASGNYTMVDNQQVKELCANATPGEVNYPHICDDSKEDVPMVAEQQKTFTYTNKYPGLIGKRDLIVHAYIYNNVSAYDYNTVVTELTTNVLSIYSDSRFADVHLIIIKHKRGETNNAIIDNVNLPWNIVTSTFADDFAAKVEYYNADHPSYLYDGMQNVYHMLVSVFGWAGAGGMAINEKHVSISSVSINNCRVPSHELSHNLGAVHTALDDVMGSNSLGFHKSQDNKNTIYNTIDIVSVKDEVLDSNFVPIITNQAYDQDLLTVSDNTANTNLTLPTNMALPSTVKAFDGQVGFRHKIKVYKVKVPAAGANAQTYLKFRISQSVFDTYLYVLDKNGNMVASDDDSGDGSTLSYISGLFNANEYYYVIVDGYPWTADPQVGTFTLKVSYAPGQSGLKPASDEVTFMTAGDGSLIETADFGFGKKATSNMLTSSNGLEVYPNPVRNGVINIKAKDLATGCSYVMTNSIGQVVSNGVLNDVRNGQAVLSLPATVAKGFYYLNITDKNQGTNYTCRFAVE